MFWRWNWVLGQEEGQRWEPEDRAEEKEGREGQSEEKQRFQRQWRCWFFECERVGGIKEE